MSIVATQVSGSAAYPRHIAIIMDGNGRWAQSRGLPRTAGHKQGVEAVGRIVDVALDLGIRRLTLFGFSTENWKRPPTEVSILMGLLRLYLQKEIAKLHKKGVQVSFIGDRADLASEIQVLMRNAETQTANNRRLELCVALSYGGRAEIVSAARKLAERVQAGDLSPEEITEDELEKQLQTGFAGDPDLLIRTSGEKRISNFLLWQTAYTELVFDDVLWPDFDREHLERAIEDYQRRERRYGAVLG